MCYEDHRLFQLFNDENEGKSIAISLEDPVAQGICDTMENLADWDTVYIKFITDEMDDTVVMRSVDFLLILNTADVPWRKSYVHLNLRCYLDGRPAVNDKWVSGGEWLSDRWVIVFHALV